MTLEFEAMKHMQYLNYDYRVKYVDILNVPNSVTKKAGISPFWKNTQNMHILFMDGYPLALCINMYYISYRFILKYLYLYLYKDMWRHVERRIQLT